MYFNTYSPATRNCVPARAARLYNAVANFCGNAEPTSADFINYCYENRLDLADRLTLMCDIEEQYAWETACRAEWAAVRKAKNNMGQPLHRQHVVYFTIIDGGLKCGETNNLVQRHCNIHRADNIHRMWYLPVENKEQARAAEHALHNIFDHARCMSRQQGKKDYYNCDTEQAQKFITKNAHKIYEAVMNAIGAEE